MPGARVERRLAVAHYCSADGHQVPGSAYLYFDELNSDENPEFPYEGCRSTRGIYLFAEAGYRQGLT